MAEAVVSFALETIGSLLVNEAHQISGYYSTRPEIEFMKDELMRMKAFLRDADARNSKDETIIHLERQIKTLTYRIEDVLETYATGIQLKRRRRGIKSALKRFISMADCYTPFAKIRAEIQSTITMISNVRSSVGVPHIVQMEDNHLLLRQTYAHGVNDYLVGMDGEIESLASLMVDDEKECRAISIYGMGGMGKSTLAKKLFNLSLVQNHFQAFAWVYVGKYHDIDGKRILQSILKQLLGVESREKVEHMEKELLYQHVYEVLHEKRCLVVLDDIWSIESWYSLRISAQRTASKILLTTRIREVAEHVSREEFVRKMRPLNDNEGWELFKTRAFLREDSPDVKVHPVIEEMGKQILKQCRGVPLAIIMLGDFMGTKHTLREWEIMYKSSESYLNRGQQLGGSATISQILALSYDNLPLRIKLCFLHLGNFPEEADIEVEKLYLLWMAEGIIEQEHRRSWVTMKDIAEDYLTELALQGMIEVQEEEVPIFRKFKSCRLHGLMREVCLLKGTEEEFMKLLDFRRGNQLLENSDAFYSTMARRLAVYLDNHEDRSVAPLMRDIAKHIHCLLIRASREDQQELVWPREILCIKEFRLLKVLDFDGLDFRKTKLPDGIAKLLSLRYLSFKGCFLSELPLCIGSMLNLQILDLRVKTYGTMIIPNVLWKIITLRCLYFPERFRTLNNTKLRLDGLTVLETLHGLNAGLCRITDLLKMTNLRQLSAAADCSLEDLKLIIRLLDRNSFEEFRSSLDIRNFDCYTEERHSVFRQLLGGRNLHVFHIEGHIGQLPSEHHISKSFVEIVLSGSELKKDPMAILGKLPDLQVLVLKDEACLAEKIVCPESGFLKLKRLELSNLRCLKVWTLEAGSLCMLSKLTIESCRELKTLPDRLRSLRSLQKVMIIKMSSPFRHSLLGKWEDTYTSEYVHPTLILSPKLVL